MWQRSAASCTRFPTSWVSQKRVDEENSQYLGDARIPGEAQQVLGAHLAQGAQIWSLPGHRLRNIPK